MNRKIIICITCALIAIGCKKVSVDFTYSPAMPKAGETVVFTNNSSAGEKWAWRFGDNTVSVLRNPNKIFKKPGTYVVTLMVDSAKYNTCSHPITIYDTIPTFVVSSDSIFHYHDVTFSANIYNPFNYSLSYQWNIPDDCVLLSNSLTGSSITVYFTTPNAQKTVELTIQQGSKQHPLIRHSFTILETKAPALVMQCGTNIYRQRMINERLETAQKSQLQEDKDLLSTSTDTCVTFNGKKFCASKMEDIFPEHTVQRLQIDVMAQKWYITTPEGLYVANINGQNLTLIDTEASGALHIDAMRNLLYWATPSGLKAMALVKSKNNQFATTPILYNDLSDIDRIVVNNNHR